MPTVAKTNALAAGVGAAQQNEYDTNAGPKLLMAARDGDASKVHTPVALHPPSERSRYLYNILTELVLSQQIT